MDRRLDSPPTPAFPGGARRRRPASWLGLVLLAAVASGCGSTPPPSATATPAPTPAPATPLASPTPVASPTPASSAAATPAPSPTPGPSPAGIILAAADVPRPPAIEDPTKAASAVNAFGLDLYRRLAAEGGNVVISPTSIAFALAMARFGARGETAAEMDAVLRSLGSDEAAAALNALDQALVSRSGTFEDEERNRVPVVLRMVNTAFAQSGYPLEAAYLEALATRLGAALRLVDYIADPAEARRLVNDWVSRWTEKRIPELLEPADVDTLTRLVLVNAIYLKAAWTHPFDPADTKPGSFTLLDGSTVRVPMMALDSTGLGPSLPCAVGDGWKAIELPFLGVPARSAGDEGHWSEGSLALTVIVPDDLRAFEKRLTPAGLSAALAKLDRCKVSLRMPRFGVASATRLADVLKAMGMPVAFDPVAADFTGIANIPGQPLYISKVIHQANIDVDEKGAEAAAATAVVMTVGGPGDTSEPIVIRVDRPFLFLVRDVPTGAILFMGRVVDPS